MLKRDRDSSNRKLLIVPSYPNALGGTTFTTFLLIKGIHQLGLAKHIEVFVEKETILENLLIEAGFIDCLKIIDAGSFFKSALQQVHQYPSNYPLLLYNAVLKEKLPQLLQASLLFRLNKRPIYHSCHDLSYSHNLLGNLARKITFACLSPKAICNSQYTASYVRSIMPNIRGVLYPPVDLPKISHKLAQNCSPPENLKPILASGKKIVLTPTRINQPGIINDKNLRALLPVLAELQGRGCAYHFVIIGRDGSKGQIYTKDLLQQAEALKVKDCFSILPPTLAIEDYYKFSDLVLTLAPREPFGRTVIEAISCGVPIVGSNTGGINEILQNFAPGWTVNSEDPIGVANKILKVAESNNSAILKSGQDWIELNCTVKNYASGVMKIIGII